MAKSKALNTQNANDIEIAHKNKGEKKLEGLKQTKYRLCRFGSILPIEYRTSLYERRCKIHEKYSN